jgi:thiamine biosynthesis protein ThiI
VKVNKTFIVRCGEVALKGMNKPFFERMLVERIKKALKNVEGMSVRREDGLIVVRTKQDVSDEIIIGPVKKIFGVDSISPAVEVKSSIDEIFAAAVSYTKKVLQSKGFNTFKVEVKRSEKSFPLKSPDIARQVGGEILSACDGIKVDVHNPEFRLYVHVRKERTFIFEQKISGLGGLPLGSNGKGLILLSGGIDSPVAAFLMAKRGMFIEAVHFHSYPYTGERAYEKVKELARILSLYCGRIKIHSINLLPIQEEIVEKCPDDEITILIRRFMLKIAERIARDTSPLMLITGENLGQVASQTAEALVVTDAAVTMPIMRPLIGMDKAEIIEKAKEIGTYETSILPYEDCCTVFLPKHPKTKPKLSEILKSESRLDVAELIDAVIDNKVVTIIDN